MQKEKMYSIAIRNRDNEHDHFWYHNDFLFEECKIDCEEKYWIADPFIFEKDGVAYIFYEAYDLVQKRGLIGYSKYKGNDEKLKVNIIINENYHLSFPNVFVYDNDIYIMPESCADYSLHLYKAISFPDKWERTDDILPDVYACDSVFIVRNNKTYLLTNEMYHNPPKGKFSSCWVKNYLYEVSNLKVKHFEGVKVSEGEFGIRNAGKTFECEGVLYRIGQDCRMSQYGRGLVLYKISNLSPYQEEVIRTWGVDDFVAHIRDIHLCKLLGVHTYNMSEHYEVIDFSQMKTVKYNVIFFRSLRYVTQLLTRIQRKF